MNGDVNHCIACLQTLDNSIIIRFYISVIKYFTADMRKYPYNFNSLSKLNELEFSICSFLVSKMSLKEYTYTYKIS